MTSLLCVPASSCTRSGVWDGVFLFVVEIMDHTGEYFWLASWPSDCRCHPRQPTVTCPWWMLKHLLGAQECLQLRQIRSSVDAFTGTCALQACGGSGWLLVDVPAVGLRESTVANHAIVGGLRRERERQQFQGATCPSWRRLRQASPSEGSGRCRALTSGGRCLRHSAVHRCVYRALVTADANLESCTAVCFGSRVTEEKRISARVIFGPD